MQRISHWYQNAYKALELGLAALTVADGEKAIQVAAAASYPFGPRGGWPYKQFLRARKLILFQRFPTLFPRPKDKATLATPHVRRISPGDGQPELF